MIIMTVVLNRLFQEPTLMLNLNLFFEIQRLREFFYEPSGILSQEHPDNFPLVSLCIPDVAQSCRLSCLCLDNLPYINLYSRYALSYHILRESQDHIFESFCLLEQFYQKKKKVQRTNQGTHRITEHHVWNPHILKFLIILTPPEVHSMEQVAPAVSNP